MDKNFYLGADIGGTKTHVLIVDEAGCVAGFGDSGSGSTDSVGYDGFAKALKDAAGKAFASAGLSPDEISGAGFGLSGYDWPWQRDPSLRVIEQLGLKCPLELVNDTILGLLAGSEDGWGVAVVSGTGCNCWGWDVTRQRVGRLTGGGYFFGEHGGGGDLVARAARAVAFEWTRRGPATLLTQALIELTGAASAPDLLEGLMSRRYELSAAAAPLVFEIAKGGDEVAIDVIRWAGGELGDMANGVIRQLEFENLEFNVILVGSLYKGGDLLIKPMEQTIHSLAPGARLLMLSAPPVVGAVILAMEQAGALCSQARQALANWKP